ncbi:MAG: PmbA/TldA family metallopeptidase, partial [Thermocrinis sp.]|uniref:PmbA/TldA family metallopeptidase n=1 Tax=Thermocrinis sp. TaxID=2024383 RepID=UPI003C0C1198
MNAKELIKEKAGYILSNLLSRGGEYGEIFYERSRTCRMQLEDNKIDKVQWGEEEGVGIRLIKEGKTYYGYTTEITYENLLEIAKALARGQGHGPVAIGKRHIKGWTSTLIDPDEMSLSYRAELLHRANQKARGYGDKIKQVLAVLMDKTRDIMVINSLGERAEDLQKRVVFFV